MKKIFLSLVFCTTLVVLWAQLPTMGLHSPAFLGALTPPAPPPPPFDVTVTYGPSGNYKDTWPGAASYATIVMQGGGGSPVIQTQIFSPGGGITFEIKLDVTGGGDGILGYTQVGPGGGNTGYALVSNGTGSGPDSTTSNPNPSLYAQFQADNNASTGTCSVIIRYTDFDPGFPAPKFFGGANYAKPTLKWLQGPCYDAFYKRYWDANLQKWRVRWECRDFARAFASFAQECNALTPDEACPPGEDILAVGEIWFIPDKQDGEQLTGHAINVCVTDQGIICIDPQNNRVWDMSESEFDSAYYIRF